MKELIMISLRALIMVNLFVGTVALHGMDAQQQSQSPLQKFNALATFVATKLSPTNPSKTISLPVSQPATHNTNPTTQGFACAPRSELDKNANHFPASVHNPTSYMDDFYGINPQ